VPSDLTTVETVTAGDYEVRVAQTGDGRAWEAVVLTDDAGTSSLNSQIVFGHVSTGKRGGTESGDETAAPAVTAPHKWVAVGFAIEAFEWRQADGGSDETVSVPEAYSETHVDGEPLDAIIESVDLAVNDNE